MSLQTEEDKFKQWHILNELEQVAVTYNCSYEREGNTITITVPDTFPTPMIEPDDLRTYGDNTYGTAETPLTEGKTPDETTKA